MPSIASSFGKLDFASLIFSVFIFLIVNTNDVSKAGEEDEVGRGTTNNTGKKEVSCQELSGTINKQVNPFEKKKIITEIIFLTTASREHQ